jgi:lipopolysaccharide export system protein LptA
MRFGKRFFLFLAFAFLLCSQSFAARGVDYNGEGNPITIVDQATGLKIETGKSIYLGDGSTFLTGAGAVTIPGSSNLESLTVNPGNITVTAGNILLSNGTVDIYGGHLNVLNGNAIIYDGNLVTVDGAISAGNGLVVNSGSNTITAGNLLISAGDATLTSGDLNIIDTNKKITYGAVEFLSGTATARADLRGLNGGAGDSAPIGSVYYSSGGKIYIKIANAGADADWYLVTATDSD